MIQEPKRSVNLPKKQSFLLLGPRQTGKSTLIGRHFGANAWSIDLLKSELFLAYSKEPHRLRTEAEYQIEKQGKGVIIVDEVQKVPLILDEVQYLMGRHPQVQFVLTGSSARKLKRGAANLLAGRAVQRFLFPFTYREVVETESGFDLDSCLRFGMLPSLWRRDQADKIDILEAYSRMYLQEEIQAEGIARNIGGFARFLEVAASSFGEITNYSNIARECMLSARTVQSYYDILEDTLVGFRLPGWGRSVRKQLSIHPKFYFFDNGVVNGLTRQLKGDLERKRAGHLFEHWLVNEVRAALHYERAELSMHYWRTKGGSEVDLVLSHGSKPVAAIEFKYTRSMARQDFSGLKSLIEDYPGTKGYLVSDIGRPQLHDGIEALPWRDFVSETLPKLLKGR
jgi:predicted AAA+ superfamily ATPase